MAYEEKRAWIMAVVALGAYAVYLGRVGPGLAEASAATVPYAAALIWSVAGSILAGIVLNVVAGIGVGAGSRTDRRDIEIHRAGQYIGQSFLVLGGVAALAMALARWDTFWIANVLYLGFTLSAVVASAAKIVAYRRGFLGW
ncbi:hypothetical protein [Nocardioides sp. zg-DK7169]|uniref:hypothetical protein n=1 Tax=Nocardioides sp. zg-DK7169 TaxID=2736600 RepID=UPI0015553F2C|nr:hypothetical protein [Nocardioides sp. zg-DK7169]NPC96459.1 hypothetical protein [Nocardioides sp. zg-DK7169]